LGLFVTEQRRGTLHIPLFNCCCYASSPNSTGFRQVAIALQAMRSESAEIPEIAQVDQLQTFVGSKKTNFGYGQPSISTRQVSLPG
jgi:hypothetical protein